MAILKNSPLQGLSGTLGDLIFRTRNGKTHVYVKSSTPRKQSDAQKKNRERFRNAALKATHLLEDDAMFKHYHHQAMLQDLPNAYTAALRDMMMTTNE